MRVNPNSQPLSTDPLGATKNPTPSAAPETRLGFDNLSVSTAEGISNALEETPSTRPEKVELAKTLVADSAYPPLELIQKISALIARSISK